MSGHMRIMLYSSALIMIAGAVLVPEQARASAYTFQTLNNSADPTFNQLLGINNGGTIVGYFGSGAAGFPNKGYKLAPPTTYTNENFPASAQTQVTGINNVGTTVGFWSASNSGGGADANFGFVAQGGVFTTVNNPSVGSSPAINQLLGVNDANIAVGFYNDAGGASHGYTYNIATTAFTPVVYSLAASLTAAAINNSGQIAGFYVDSGMLTHGFLDNGGVFTPLDAPGAIATMLFGLNNLGQAVGVETVSGGKQHGVIFNSLTDSWQVLDDPNGIGTTTFNGLNDRGQIVGFYVDSAGNTDGLLATTVPEPESFGILAAGVLGLVAGKGRRRLGSAFR